MTMDDDDTAPMCPVCSHAHEQVRCCPLFYQSGSKCPVCGHIGKSRLFQLLRNQPMAFVFSIQSYDGTPRIKLTRKMARLVVGLRVFTRLLRKRIFPTEPFDEAGAAAYRHIVAFVGDAPIGTASWRVVTDDGGSVVAVEHFGVLEEKRRRGYGKQLLQAVVEDIKQTLVDWQVAAEAIAVHVPESDSIVGIKMLQLGGFELDPQPRVVNSVSCLRLLLRG